VLRNAAVSLYGEKRAGTARLFETEISKMKTALTLAAVASLGLLAACGEKAAEATVTTTENAAPAADAMAADANAAPAADAMAADANAAPAADAMAADAMQAGDAMKAGADKASDAMAAGAEKAGDAMKAGADKAADAMKK